MSDDPKKPTPVGQAVPVADGGDATSTRPGPSKAALAFLRSPELSTMIVAVRAAARAKGYALAVHGSQQRDIDLIAVAWVDEAAPAQELAEAIRIAADGAWGEDKNDPFDWVHSGARPQPKPHGRLAWTIWTRGTYLDLSVIGPR